ncbi:hypothetical protein OROGR_015250 [Orobanche gracilis]
MEIAIDYFKKAFFEGNPFKTVPGPFKLFYRCMRSKPGWKSLLSPSSIWNWIPRKEK